MGDEFLDEILGEQEGAEEAQEPQEGEDHSSDEVEPGEPEEAAPPQYDAEQAFAHLQQRVPEVVAAELQRAEQQRAVEAHRARVKEAVDWATSTLATAKETGDFGTDAFTALEILNRAQALELQERHERYEQELAEYRQAAEQWQYHQVTLTSEQQANALRQRMAIENPTEAEDVDAFYPLAVRTLMVNQKIPYEAAAQRTHDYIAGLAAQHGAHAALKIVARHGAALRAKSQPQSQSQPQAARRMPPTALNGGGSEVPLPRKQFSMLDFLA